MDKITTVEAYEAALKESLKRFRSFVAGLKADKKRAVSYAEVRDFGKDVEDRVDVQLIATASNFSMTGPLDKAAMRYIKGKAKILDAAGIAVKR